VHALARQEYRKSAALERDKDASMQRRERGAVGHVRGSLTLPMKAHRAKQIERLQASVSIQRVQRDETNLKIVIWITKHNLIGSVMRI
jgi:hypothetical protein